MTKPLPREGALVGAILTTAFLAVSFLGWKALAFPFLPFDLFDWIARVLPGPLVTLGVDAIVRLSGLIGGSNLDAAAKPIEQATAVGGVFLLGTLGGAGIFALLRLTSEPPLLPSGIVGAILGGLALVIEERLDRIASGPALGGPWLFSTVFAWGVSIGWAYDRLSRVGSAGQATAPEGRRRFLVQIGGSTLAAAFMTTLAGVLFGGRDDSLAGARWSDTHPLPNADAVVVPLAGTRPELTPLDRHYRVDTNTRAPQIDAAQWRLKVGGLVQSPLSFTLDEIRQHEPLHQFATLSCISNPPGGDLISTIRWTGVSLARLLPQFKLSAGATHLRIRSADGFFESVAIAAIQNDERIVLAYAWDGVALPPKHGFPLRLFIPDLYGMKQPKWIVAIDAVDGWQPGYWVSRGWDREGHTAVASAIDVIRAAPRSAGDRAVELGGIAFAGSRRVSKVELRVDDGEWQAAEIRDPLSDTTWVIWRASVTVLPGAHAFTVRAFDGEGRVQQENFHTRRSEA
jgi:DMSO/TMAO reductase YedYZ molybdopterin-dependent catalytic subunit